MSTPIDLYLLAQIIVSAFLAGGAYFGASRADAGAWLAFTLGLVTYGFVMAVHFR